MRKLKEPVNISSTRLSSPDVAIYVQERLIDKIITEEREDGHGNKYSVCPNDIHLFIDQTKLAKFDQSVQQGVLNDFKRMSSSLSESLRGQSDDDIIKSVKSRYIQSTADVHNYTRALSEAIRDELSDYRSRVAKSKLKDPSPELKDPSPKLKDPSPKLKDPSSE